MEELTFQCRLQCIQTDVLFLSVLLDFDQLSLCMICYSSAANSRQ